MHCLNERERKTYLWLSEEQRTTADDKSIEQGVDFMKDIKKNVFIAPYFNRTTSYTSADRKRSNFLSHKTIFKVT